MKSQKELFALLQPKFEAAIIDQLKTRADKGGGVLIPSTELLDQAAVDAMLEISESEFDSEGKPYVLSPMLVLAVWQSCIKTNESAFRKKLEVREKAGTLPFKLASAGAKVKATALSYLE